MVLTAFDLVQLFNHGLAIALASPSGSMRREERWAWGATWRMKSKTRQCFALGDAGFKATLLRTPLLMAPARQACSFFPVARPYFLVAQWHSL